LATAIHEAGHAVAELSMPPSQWIDAIWVRREPEGWSGLVEVQARWQPSTADLHFAEAANYRELREARAREDILVFIAGPVAEWRWRFRSRIGAQFAGTEVARVCAEQEHRPGSDMDRIKVRLQWLGVADLRSAVRDAWYDAEALLAREWPAVTAIGRALVMHKRLEDEHVRALWDAHRRDRHGRRAGL